MLFFIDIIINDLVNFTNIFALIMHADDATLFCDFDNVNISEEIAKK